MSRDTDTSKESASTIDAAASVADAFVRARLRAEPLAGFPGAIPVDLVAAYRVQDLAIARWPDRIVGWKVGYIAEARRDASGDERLLGPIYARRCRQAAGDAAVAVFAGGFGAIEAEYVLRLEADAPADRLDWTPEQTVEVPATLWTGLEIASSPLATINALGPCVVVSDFGNNNGLVLGAQIPDWRGLAESDLLAESWVDGECVGRGGAAALPGGLAAAYAFALSRSARRGRPLKAGELIATGNATGIHEVRAGQRIRVSFGRHGDIAGHVVAVRPVGDGAGE